MATRKQTLEAAARGEGCLGKAREDEPVFVLRAQDASAPAVIRFWASINLATISTEKCNDAIKTSFEMERWPLRKLPT